MQSLPSQLGAANPSPEAFLQQICPAAAPSLTYELKSTLLTLQCQAASPGGVKANRSLVHRPLLEGAQLPGKAWDQSLGPGTWAGTKALSLL